MRRLSALIVGGVLGFALQAEANDLSKDMNKLEKRLGKNFFCLCFDASHQGKVGRLDVACTNFSLH